MDKHVLVLNDQQQAPRQIMSTRLNEHVLSTPEVDVKSAHHTLGNTMHMRIAMVGDDRTQMFLLRRALLTAGHTPEYYKTSSEFLDAVNHFSFEVLIIGTLGSQAGELEVLGRVRGVLNLTVPVIVVTTERSEDWVVNVLRTGADDCIVLPVGQSEFLARLEAIVRRWIHVPTALRSFRAGRITVHVQSRRILVDDEPVELTSKDFDLALFLLHNVGRLVSRSQILHAIWGRRHQLIRSRTLDTHMSRVRRRLQLVESQGWRLTAVYRRGYRLERLKKATKEQLEE